MAIKHALIKPIRHAGVASQDAMYVSAGAIVEGAPVILLHTSGAATTGKVSEATDLAAGPLIATGSLVGFAMHACSAANQDCLVALALPGRRFVASLADNDTVTDTDAGAKVLALADIGSLYELHKDVGTSKWVLGGAPSSLTANILGLVTALVDKIGATTNDTPTFGSTGGGPGVAMTTTPLTTSLGHPTGSNSGFAKVEFVVPIRGTIWGF